jgi:ribosomal-protein-alanine N-acetyltransferase
MRNRSLANLFGLRPWNLFESRHQWPDLPDDLRLEGERALLRWPRSSDAEGVFSYAGDPEVSRFMDWSAHQSVEESRRFLASLQRSRMIGREAAFAVVEKSSDEMVGICSLVSSSDRSLSELGYALRRSAWGEGFMTEAVSLICPWAFRYLGLREIFAEVHPNNRGSQRVLEKNGFVRQAEPVKRRIKGVEHAHYHYRLLNESFPSRER